MKMKLIQTGLLAIALIICITGCKKDEKARKNEFIYNQKTSEIGPAYGYQNGETETAGVYSITLLLFEKAITISQNNSQAYYNLGVVYGLMGNLEQKIKANRNAAQLGHQGAQQWLSQNGYTW